MAASRKSVHRLERRIEQLEQDVARLKLSNELLRSSVDESVFQHNMNRYLMQQAANHCCRHGTPACVDCLEADYGLGNRNAPINISSLNRLSTVPTANTTPTHILIQQS